MESEPYEEIAFLPAFLAPSPEYYKYILGKKVLVIYDEEYYQKQSWRNHFDILTSQGKLKITFPVRKPWKGKRIKDIQLDLNQKWIRNHWRSIKTAYSKTPFFEYYEALFEPIFSQTPERLIDLNMKILAISLKILSVKTKVLLFSSLQIKEKEQLLLKNQDFLKKWDSIFCMPDDELAYTQLFGNEFVRDTSIIDMMFNLGPESLIYLNKNVNK